MGIKALGYVIIGATDPARWDHFLTEGLGVMRAGQSTTGAALYRIDDRPFRFWIEQADSDSLIAAAYEVSQDRFAPLADAIRAAGRDVAMGSDADATARGVTSFFRTTDPAGNRLEFFHGDSKSDTPFVSPQGISHFVTGDMGMGHAVFAAMNFDETHNFYRNICGFHDTDMPRFHFSPDPADPGMGFAFMHADNGRHHSIAFGEMPSPPSGCVHLMLEAPTLIDVGKAYDRVRNAGYPISATLGQHVNDAMVSFYVQTPSGFDMEFGYDGLVIDPAKWQPTAHQQVSTWGHVWAWQEAIKEQMAAEAANAAATPA